MLLAMRPFVFCMFPLIAVDLTVYNMTVTGEYDSFVRSYTRPYTVDLKLQASSQHYRIVENTDDWVNYEVWYFYSSTEQSGRSH